jgi:hypothetical protein
MQSDWSKDLICFLQMKLSANEIASRLNITNKQLYNYLTMLKNSGFDFKKNYCFNGDIIYSLSRKLTDLDTKYEIFIPRDIDKFEFVAISDIHFGSLRERTDYLDVVYNYCLKEGIHTIIIGGDLIDGTLGNGQKKFDTIYEQIEHLRKDYPFDKSILNYAILGDHDYSSLSETGQDLSLVLKNYRHDIVPIGYSLGKIWLKNDYITIFHPVKSKGDDFKVELENYNLLFKGHSHKGMVYNSKVNSLTVTLPILCDLRDDKRTFPGFVRGMFTFQDDVIKYVNLSQLSIVDNSIIKVNEFVGKINSIKKRIDYVSYDELVEDTSVTSVEESDQETVTDTPKKLEKKPSSQIEKFNKKYMKSN